MIVVSDASPIIGLCLIGRFDLLRLLYGHVLIPPEVAREISAADAPGAAETAAADWVEVRPLHDGSLADSLAENLDRGEAEAIALALETRADLLLMDERRGRAVAFRLGQEVVGVLGLLIEAKRRGYVTGVRPLLDALAFEAGFRISPVLRAKVLEAAGED